MKRIDAHVHIFDHLHGLGRNGELRALSNGYARWATGGKIKVIPDGLGDREFLAETVLQLLDLHQVEKAVLLQGIIYGFMNEYVQEMVARYPDRLIGAGTYDPHALNADRILDRLVGELGYRIIKFEFSEGGGLMGFHESFQLDGERMQAFWERAERDTLTVVMDIGSPGMISYQYQAVAGLARKYPTVQIVIPHLGAPTLDTGDGYLDMLRTLAPCENVAFDLAALQWNVAPEAAPYPTAMRYLVQARDLIGSKRLMWGTDIPFAMTRFTYEDMIGDIEGSGVFGGAELADVFWNTAERVYFGG